MNLRRGCPGKRRNLPNTSAMGKAKETTAVGAEARNKYCLPSDYWVPNYGALLPVRLMLKRFSTGELVEHVVFHSANHRNHLLDLQDYKSNQITTTTYRGATDLSPKQEEYTGSGTAPLVCSMHVPISWELETIIIIRRCLLFGRQSPIWASIQCNFLKTQETAQSQELRPTLKRLDVCPIVSNQLSNSRKVKIPRCPRIED